MTDDFNEQAGTFLRVNVDDGGWFAIREHDASVVRKAVLDYRERGIDSLIEVEGVRGEIIAVAVSTVTSFYLSTPEIRAANALGELRQEEWVRDFRKQHKVAAWDE